MEQSDRYSFCETALAGSASRWHIRRLTAVGRKLGGGADTPSLCGRKVAWDLDVQLTDYALAEDCCRLCFQQYKQDDIEYERRQAG